MTEHVGFLEQLPGRAVARRRALAFGDDRTPDGEEVQGPVESSSKTVVVVRGGLQCQINR